MSGWILIWFGLCAVICGTPRSPLILPETQMVLLREALSGSADVGQSWPQMTIPDFSPHDAFSRRPEGRGRSLAPQCERQRLVPQPRTTLIRR